MLLPSGVFFAGYLARLPIVERVYPEVSELVKRTLGMAPQPFRIGNIDVFNEYDLNVYRRIAATYILMPDGERKSIVLPIGEVGDYKSALNLRDAVWSRSRCASNFTKHLAEYAKELLREDDPSRRGIATTEYMIAIRPSRDDFLAKRCAPMTWWIGCVSSVPIEGTLKK